MHLGRAAEGVVQKPLADGRRKVGPAVVVLEEERDDLDDDALNDVLEELGEGGVGVVVAGDHVEEAVEGVRLLLRRRLVLLLDRVRAERWAPVEQEPDDLPQPVPERHALDREEAPLLHVLRHTQPDLSVRARPLECVPDRDHRRLHEHRQALLYTRQGLASQLRAVARLLHRVLHAHARVPRHAEPVTTPLDMRHLQRRQPRLDRRTAVVPVYSPGGGQPRRFERAAQSRVEWPQGATHRVSTNEIARFMY